MAANSWRSPDRITTRTPRFCSAKCMAVRTFLLSDKNPPQVSGVPKRQFLVNGTDVATIFQCTPAGSGDLRKVSNAWSCVAPSMVGACIGSCAGLEELPYKGFDVPANPELAFSGRVRYLRVSIIKKDAGPCVNWKYVVLADGPLGVDGGSGGLTDT